MSARDRIGGYLLAVAIALGLFAVIASDFQVLTP